MPMKIRCKAGWICSASGMSNKQDPDLLKAGIKDWQRRYPVNPAAKTLPTQLNNVLTSSPASTEKIALFLPMSGPAQVYGNAIQQGFNAAINGSPVPASATAGAPADPKRSGRSHKPIQMRPSARRRPETRQPPGERRNACARRPSVLPAVNPLRRSKFTTPALSLWPHCSLRRSKMAQRWLSARCSKIKSTNSLLTRHH